MSDISNSPQAPPQRRSLPVKPLLFGALAAAVIYVAYQFGDELSLSNLAARESELREYQSQHPILVYGLAFVIYVLVTGFSIPGATALTLLYGWYFGFLRAVVLVSFASTMGATVAFLLSRYFLGNWVQDRFQERLDAVNARFDQEGAFYLFTLRLIPLMPFFVLNLIMGLTRIRTTTYWWVSQIGMLPGTIVYVYAGSRVPNLNVLASEGVSAVISPSQLFQLTLAFALLGLFPLVTKKVLSWYTRRGKKDGRSDNGES